MDLVCWFALALLVGLALWCLSLWFDLIHEREINANLQRVLHDIRARLLRHGIEP